MTRSLLLVDNYDSFTYNLVQLFGQLGAVCRVYLNDDAALAGDLEWVAHGAAAVVMSPGPGAPAQALACRRLLTQLQGRTPLLGVCLGHQVIAEHFGARVTRAALPMHGKTSPIVHDGRTLFAGLPQGFLAARYHSLLVERENLPESLEISAETSAGEIMALRHKQWPIEGIQFHPESVLSEQGAQLLSNWLKTL